jgi:hypothetical protein
MRPPTNLIHSGAQLKMARIFKKNDTQAVDFLLFIGQSISGLVQLPSSRACL